jgi:hypothetical protein
MMSQSQAKLAEVKQKMAARYERLAKVSGSRPRRARMLRHAATYRRQAEDLLR